MMRLHFFAFICSLAVCAGEPTRVMLPNNIELSFLAEPEFENKVAVRFRLVPEKKFEANVIRYANTTFLYGGIETRSTAEFQSEKIPLNFQVTPAFWEFQGVCKKEDLAELFSLLTAYLLEPGFREEEMKRYANWFYSRQQISIDEHFEAVFRHKAPYFLSGEKQYLAFTTPSHVDLKNQMAEPLKSAYLKIAIWGDFDLRETIPFAKKVFSVLPIRAEKIPSAQFRKETFAPTEKQKTFSYNNKGVFASHCSFTWPVARDPALQLLRPIFERRLGERMRTDLGPHFGEDVFLGEQTITAIIFGLAGYEQEFFDCLQRTVDSLRREPFTAEELALALAWKRQNLTFEKKAPEYWLRLLIEHSQECSFTTFEKITPAMLTKAARQYLTEEHQTSISIIPRNPES